MAAIIKTGSRTYGKVAEQIQALKDMQVGHYAVLLGGIDVLVRALSKEGILGEFDIRNEVKAYVNGDIDKPVIQYSITKIRPIVIKGYK